RGLTVVANIIVDKQNAPSAKADEISAVRKVLADCAKAHHVHAFPQVLLAPTLHDGILSCVQATGLGVLRPNTIMMNYPAQWKEHPASQTKSFVSTLRSIIALDKALLLLYGLRELPDDADVPAPAIDVYWVMNDGGILTLLPHLLRKAPRWRRSRLRIVAIARTGDNSIVMKRDLLTTLRWMRIPAEADVAELGDADVCAFAHEATVRVRERADILVAAGVRGGADNVLALPTAGSSLDVFAGNGRRVSNVNAAHALTGMLETARRGSVSPSAAGRGTGPVGGGAIAASELVPPASVLTRAVTTYTPSSLSSHILRTPTPLPVSVSATPQRHDSSPPVVTPPDPLRTPSSDALHDMLNTSFRLNALIRARSPPTSLVFCNLPAPGFAADAQGADAASLHYMLWVRYKGKKQGQLAQEKQRLPPDAAASSRKSSGASWLPEVVLAEREK
ncbi:hypothetical protein BDK51DRAFT_32976, partial [Blyttiomyces helicus]